MISGAELEAAEDVCVSELSQLLVLSVVAELLEADGADVGRAGDSSPAGVEFSPVTLLNHRLPHENKPAEGTEQSRRKERNAFRGALTAHTLRENMEPRVREKK